MYARENTLRDRFVNDPNSPRFNQSFNFETLKLIQPYLFCTDEIAMFSLTLNADQLIPSFHFNMIEVLMFALTSNEKLALSANGNGKYKQDDGYYVAENLSETTTYSKVYNMIQSAQNKGGFNEKLSAENIKVAFNQLRKDSSYRGKPILTFEEKFKISINADFINQHFTFVRSIDSNVPEFRIKTDLGSLLQDVFNKEYANKYTKKKACMMLGTSTIYKGRKESTPFLLDVMTREPNQNVPKYNDSTSNYLVFTSSSDYQEDNDDYKRVNSRYTFKIHPEEYFFKEHMKRHTGKSGDLDEMLYKPIGEYTTNLNEIHQSKISGIYPLGYASWYANYRYGIKRPRSTTEDDVDNKKVKLN